MITIVGGANIDIEGVPKGQLIMADSNPGMIKSSLGGVGRNMADVLSRIHTKTKLITVVGDDSGGHRIVADAKDKGIDVEDVLVLSNERTSSYLFIREKSGDMVAAIADMAIVERLSVSYFAACLERIESSAYVIIDANLPEKSIHYLAENLSKPKLVFEGVSTTKVMKVLSSIGCYDLIKLNKIEAEHLLSMTIDNLEHMKDAGDKLLALGVKAVIITFGSDGAYYRDNEHNIYKKAINIGSVNVNGVGDAFLVGFIHSLALGNKPEACLDYAIALAALCVNSSQLTPEHLCDDTVQSFLKENSK